MLTHVSELSHSNVRNSGCSEWLFEACTVDKDWRVGAVHPDKVLFSPRRIYLGGKDKLSRVGILRSTGQARPEW